MTATRRGPAMRAWEPALVFVVFAAGAALLPAAGGASLWTRPYWLDELCCTVFPVRDSRSFLDLFANVRHDDVAPPLLHVVVWITSRITGSLAPVVLRTLMLAVTLGAFVALYTLLRRRFAALPSVAGTLALAAQTLVVHHAFDGRFYAPWLLLGILYAASLGTGDSPPSRRRSVAQALAALGLCTIHWFGVTSLGVMAAAAAATRGRRWRDGLRLVAPSVAGVVVLLLLVPMMRAQLAQGGDDLLWVPPLNAAQVREMASAFLVSAPMIVGFILLLGDRLRAPADRADISGALRDPGIAALLATLLMPVVLIVISIVLEPVMVPRYAILATAAAAPVVALATGTLGRWGRITVIAVLGALLVQRTGTEVLYSRYFDVTMRSYQRELARAVPSNLPLVFQSYFIMYPVDGPRRAQSPTRFLELPDSTIAALYPEPEMENARHKLTLDRNQARLHHRVFGFPIPVSQAQLDTTRAFLLFAADASLPMGYQTSVGFGSRVFPHHRARRLNRFVTLFQRAP